MKSFYYFCLCCASVSVYSTVSAQNLYDLAAPVGLQKSIPLKWNVGVNVGYDDNVNAVSRSNPYHQSSAFTSINVGASMSDIDSRTQLSYNGNIGGIFYLDKMRFGSNQVVSNTSLDARLSHVIDPTLRYSATLSLSYQPEPDYQSGITSARRSGDYFHGYFSNDISKAWTNRFSTITGFNVSFIDYQEQISSQEDTTHYGLNNVFRFKWTPRAAALLDWRANYSDRKYGWDSFSNFVLVGMEYAVDKYTNASLRVGPQIKHVVGRSTDVYLSMEGAIDRMMTNKVSLGLFARLADESTETYSYGQNYESNMSTRVGVRASYRFNPTWTLSGNINIVNSDYSKGQGIYTPDRKETTWNFSTQIDCQLSKEWLAFFSYSFTNGQYSGGLDRPSYLRNVFTLGTSRSF